MLGDGLVGGTVSISEEWSRWLFSGDCHSAQGFSSGDEHPVAFLVSWAVPSPYLTVPTGGHWYFWEGESDSEKPEGSSCAPRAPRPCVSLQHRGDLGNVHADTDGRAIFRLEDEQLKVGWKRKWGPFLTGPLSKAVVSPQRYGM